MAFKLSKVHCNKLYGLRTYCFCQWPLPTPPYMKCETRTLFTTGITQISYQPKHPSVRDRRGLGKGLRKCTPLSGHFWVSVASFLFLKNINFIRAWIGALHVGQCEINRLILINYNFANLHVLKRLAWGVILLLILLQKLKFSFVF